MMTTSAHVQGKIRAACLLLGCALFRSAAATLVSGHVIDSASHLPIPDASVSVFLPFSPPIVEFSVNTDANGYYEGDAAPGDYAMQVGAYSYLFVNTNIEVADAPLVADFSLSQPGTISGTVRSGASGVPYTNVLLLDGDDGSVVASVQSNADGSYALDLLAPGTYAVCVIEPADAYIDACYDGFDIPASGTRTFTPVVLQSGQTIAPVDFDLHPGSTISGTVYDRYTLAPITLNTLDVVLYSTAQDVVALASGSIDENGQYAIHGIAPGDYYVRAGISLQNGGTNGYYTPALHGGGDCTDAVPCPFSEDKLVSVPAEDSASGVDFELRPGHRITGRVTDAATGMGLPNVGIRACEWIGLIRETGETVTGMDGSYTLDHVVGPGAVGVSTFGADGYVNELWPDLPLFGSYSCPLAGAELTFADVDEDATGVDFALDEPGTISGHAPRVNDATWATVVLFDASTLSAVWTGTTDYNEDYVIEGLPAGEYLAAAYFNDGQDCRVYAGYTCTPVDDLPQVEAGHATPIVLQPGQSVTGIDFPASQVVFRDGFEASP